jgi:hypothetical protein
VTGASHAAACGQRSRFSWLRFSWREAWPCYLLAIFAALGLAPIAPAGLARASVALPILLGVPGALILGALRTRRSFDAVGFGSLAAVLSVVMLAFAALALNAARVPITATSAWVCLLVVCAMLAAAAQLRLRRLGRGGGEATVIDVLTPPARGAGPRRVSATRYALAALAAGGLLLTGAAYGYAKAPHPAPVGYTWLAWAGRPADGVIPVGPSGLTLPFQITHEQPAAAQFRLTADWTVGGRQRPIAEPVTVRVGADETVRGELAIPQPPGGCGYRVLVSLTELGGARGQTETINADVRASRGKAGCAP